MLKKQWILLVSLVMALSLLSACTPAVTNLTVTPAVLGTSEPIGSPVSSAEPTNAIATEVAPTTEMTAMPQMTATSESVGTEPASTTAPGTESPSLTTTPATTGEPVLIKSDDFLGFEIVDSADKVVGKVDEILVDEAGMIKYLLTDAGAFVGTTEHHVAAPWAMFEVNPEQEQIMFTGTADDLSSGVLYDPPMLDELEGPVVKTNNTEIPTEFSDLIRVSRFKDFNLKNTEDEDTGEVEELLLDLTQGGVPYAVVDFGGFLGVGEKRVAVPWDRLEVRQDAATQADVFVLDVPTETLDQAPVLDLDTLTIWPEPANSNWDVDIRDFWNSVG